MTVSRRLAIAFLAAGAPGALAAPLAEAQTARMRFTLDFVVQGPQAPFFLAAERGHYA